MTTRFALAFVALTLVVLASLEIPLGVNHARQREAELLVSAERDALLLGDTVEDQLEQPSADATDVIGAVADSYRDQTSNRVLVVDAAGIALADTDPPADAGDPVGRSFASRPEIADALAGATVTGTRVSETLGTDFLYAATPVRSGTRVLGVVRVSTSRQEIDEDIAHYWRTLAMIAGVTLLATGGVGLLLGRWVAEPVRSLQRQAHAFGNGDLDARADTASGPPEVRDLAEQFNRSSERLARSLRTTSQFAADAAHQLRTPLTVLRLRIDNLRSGPSALADDQLDLLVTEIARLDRTIDVLLALADLDEHPPTIETVDLHQVLAVCHTTWDPGAVDAGVELVHQAGPAVSAAADPSHVEQMVDNLVANALTAVPSGTRVDLVARTTDDGRPELAVVDHGPGMTQAARDRATQRHWHDDPGGTGLGLAIVDRLCQHNGAELHLDETPGGGLTARIAFQRADADAGDPGRAVAVGAG